MRQLNDRQLEVMRLRQGRLTWACIGARLGVSRERARQLHQRAMRVRQVQDSTPGTIWELSARSFNCLRNFGLPATATRDDVARVLPLLREGSRSIARKNGPPVVKNLGAQSFAEIERWVTDNGDS